MFCQNHSQILQWLRILTLILGFYYSKPLMILLERSTVQMFKTERSLSSAQNLAANANIPKWFAFFSEETSFIFLQKIQNCWFESLFLKSKPLCGIFIKILTFTEKKNAWTWWEDVSFVHHSFEPLLRWVIIALIDKVTAVFPSPGP